ncbi:hypothetical protein H2203_005058 [Taxawa tesnikishii (nom. ined.)]|nr:hypothetical protein H2203_005058 [Dothideales sp. JES 119]
MSSLLALLSSRQTQLQTRQALLVLGLQKDFTEPDGKLPVSNTNGYLDRIRELVPAFREHGDIVWVRTEYKENRLVNQPNVNGCDVVTGRAMPSRQEQEEARRDLPGLHGAPTFTGSTGEASGSGRRGAPAPPSDSPDVEEFLTRTADREPCCIPGTRGAEYASEIADLIDPAKDIQKTKSYYSAFQSTNLLLTLRAKLITEVYICGCNTNLSVYATCMDAARHGLTLNIIEDCLGYRKQERHDEAVKQMIEVMGAYMTTKDQTLSRLRGGLGDLEPEDDIDRGPDADSDLEEELNSVRQPSLAPDMRGLFNYLTLNERATATAATADSLERASSAEHSESQEVGLADHVGHDVNSGSRTASLSSRRGNFVERPVTRSDAASVTLDKEASSRGGPASVSTEEASLDSLSAEPVQQSNSTFKNHSASKIHGIEYKSTMGDENSVEQKTGTETFRQQLANSLKLREQQFTSHSEHQEKRAWEASPTVGPDETIGAGDSYMIYDLLPAPLSDLIFDQLYSEVQWQRMYHAAGEVPRLVCCQGVIDPYDGSMPVYRHPSDQSLPLLHWSPSVLKVKREAEKKVGHPLNHVLIQLYRSGHDHISEHSDKTLDIVSGSKIVNASFGAQRTMRLRTKRTAPTTTVSGDSKQDKPPTDGSFDVLRGDDLARSRSTQRILMPHNSIFIMGLKTNETWLHGINPDKRLTSERAAAELAYGGMRISLTFRNIGTRKEDARASINGVEAESEKIIKAFGIENQSTTFDGSATYGAGFDVLHLKTTLHEEEPRMLFLSSDELDNISVRMYLAHLGTNVVVVDSPAKQETHGRSSRRKLCFRDTDRLHTQVERLVPILLYLRRFHSGSPSAQTQLACEFEMLTSNSVQKTRSHSNTMENLEDSLRSVYESIGDGDGDEVFLAGSEFGPVDCVYWPFLARKRQEDVKGFARSYPTLDKWVHRVAQRASTASIVDSAGHLVSGATQGHS